MEVLRLGNVVWSNTSVCELVACEEMTQEDGISTNLTSSVFTVWKNKDKI
jgi:hypothetical protein